MIAALPERPGLATAYFGGKEMAGFETVGIPPHGCAVVCNVQLCFSVVHRWSFWPPSQPDGLVCDRPTPERFHAAPVHATFVLFRARYMARSIGAAQHDFGTVRKKVKEEPLLISRKGKRLISRLHVKRPAP